jgi:chemotaxis protein MotB
MARKKKNEETSGNGGFLVMSVSLNLILLIFFVYLNSIGASDQSRIKKALGSLIGRFGFLPGGVHLSSGEEILPPGAPAVSLKENPTDLAKRFAELLEKELFKDAVDLAVEGDDLILNFSEEILFPPGSAELQPGAEAALQRISKLLQGSSYPVRVEGHTDDIPIETARFPSNWELSAERAASVMKVLEGPGGIPKGRLSAMGFGEHRPLAENDGPENRARNRRVNIVLVGGKNEQKR